MIVASWNVNSISVRLPHILEWLQEVNPDVVCLQETKSVDEKFPLAQLNEAGYQCSFFGERAYNGVAILSKLPAENIQKGFIGEQEPFSRRFIEAKVGPIYVLNCYIPNGQAVGSEKYEYKLRWLESLKSYLHQHKNSALPTVLCGDFNICPLDVDICKPEEFLGTIMCSDVERQALDEIKNWGFVDTFRKVNEQGGEYTWWDYRMGAFRRNLGFRIDHIWATSALCEKVSRSWIDKSPRKKERPSDHAPLLTEFSI